MSEMARGISLVSLLRKQLRRPIISLPAGGFIIDSMTFKYRRKITITEQSGSDLTDYQVLIELNSTNFDFSHAQTNGEDIRFTDADGNLLDYWIEEWDALNETAKVWVKVPSIPANDTAEIYMYYGNSEITSASNASETFIRVIDGLVASWHLDEGSGTTAYDTSGNDNDGTLGPGSGSVSNEKFTSNYDNWVQLKHTNIDEDSEIVTTLDESVTYIRGIDYEMDYANGKIKVLSTGSMEDNTDYYIDYTYSNSHPLWVDGKFGKALNFDGVDDNVKLTSNPDLTQGGSFEAWISPVDVDVAECIWMIKPTGASDWISVIIRWGNLGLSYYDGDAGTYRNAAKSFPSGSWYHIVATWTEKGQDRLVYINGDSSSQLDGYNNWLAKGHYIGSEVSEDYFNGVIDEVRIYNRTLSEEEISDLHNNYGYTTENYPGKVLVRKYTRPEPSVSVEVEETA